MIFVGVGSGGVIASAAETILAAATAPASVEPDDLLLTTEEMADKMRLTPEQLNRRGAEFPFRVKLGWRTVRWSLHGYHKYLKKLAA